MSLSVKTLGHTAYEQMGLAKSPFPVDSHQIKPFCPPVILLHDHPHFNKPKHKNTQVSLFLWLFISESSCCHIKLTLNTFVCFSLVNLSFDIGVSGTKLVIGKKKTFSLLLGQKGRWCYTAETRNHDICIVMFKVNI